jgi:hypothetical protein
LWVYFCFYFGKASPADVLIRHKVGSITGYYTMPHWFDYPQLRNTLGDFDLKYKTEYPGSDWKADLMGDNIHSQKLALLYGLALFNCMVYDLPENDDLYARADSLYVPRSLS